MQTNAWLLNDKQINSKCEISQKNCHFHGFSRGKAAADKQKDRQQGEDKEMEKGKGERRDKWEMEEEMVAKSGLRQLGWTQEESLALSPTRSSSLCSGPKHHLGQNKHEVPPSTQEISDERKEQQTKSAEKKLNKTAKRFCGQCGIMLHGAE